ncbi:hypothetical protein FA95DRAFT_1226259 [Auriscalpium vulgare]|uniref:Uncharacterized protein n=1 Tax=Auriscalpium vulgare TaxID=40419 RepID=A0ACB8RUV5_9AGAM|nr:hypothetical protein FA95DRAFT_1226259 [Auriscalpium vulgare]
MLTPLEETQELALADGSDPDFEPTLYGGSYASARMLEEPQPHDVRDYEAYWEMNSRDMAQLRELIDASYDNPGEWFLCNLSKREFVLARTINDLMGDKTKGPFNTTRVGLGTVILSRICWPSDSSSSIERGEWAGDRFRMTTERAFEETEDRAE